MRIKKFLFFILLSMVVFACPVFADTFYADSVNGSSSNTGTSRANAMASLAQAIALASDGDTLVALANHVETYTNSTALPVNISVTIKGIGSGSTQPVISNGNATSSFSITAANVIIDNIGFAASTAYTSLEKGFIDVAADNFVMKNCVVKGSASDLTFVTMGAGSTDFKILDNLFEVTGNGPNRGIYISGTTVNGVISGNTFDGMSSTNTFDDAAVYSTVAHGLVTFENNTFLNYADVDISGRSVFTRLSKIERLESKSIALTGGSVANVLTVTGGPVKITAAYLTFTANVSANACALTLTVDPTTGADTALGSSVDINGVAAGGFISWNADSSETSGVASRACIPATSIPMSTGGFIVPIGTVDLTLANSDPSTGAAFLTIEYVPLSVCSNVVIY